MNYYPYDAFRHSYSDGKFIILISSSPLWKKIVSENNFAEQVLSVC